MPCGFYTTYQTEHCVGCELRAVMPVSLSVSQSLGQQRRIGSGSIATNTSASLVTCVVQELACSCLSRDQVSRVRGYCVGESRPSSGIRTALVAFCGLLCGMDTSSEVADWGPITY